MSWNPGPKTSAALTAFFAVLMVGGTVGHIVVPELYAPLVPSFIPLEFANIASVIVEGGLALALIVPKTRRLGVLGFGLLMTAFFPLHVMDLFNTPPLVGSVPAAVVRLVVQTVLIWLAIRVFRALTERLRAEDVETAHG